MSNDGRDEDKEPGGGWTIRGEPSSAPLGGEQSGTSSGPTFHVGCGTLSLAAIVGYPLGMVLSDVFFGDPGFGGFIGIFVMMLVFGFFTRRFQIMAKRGARLPGFLGDHLFWVSLGIGAFFGFFLGPVGSGLIAGLVGGLAFFLVWRLLLRR